MNTKMLLESYIMLEGDINKYENITNSVNIKKTNYIPYLNRIITNCNCLNIVDNKIIINSCFIHLIKICYNDNNLIRTIFKYLENKREFEYTINNTIYILSF